MRVSPQEAERALNEARRKYTRVLSCWALDALSLRRRGLDRPAYAGRVAQDMRETRGSAPMIDSVAG